MILSIKVLGPGCAKCDFLEQRARLALADIQAEDPDVEATIEKVADMDTFLEYGLMLTPGLVINDRLVCDGRVATAKRIAGWLREALTST